MPACTFGGEAVYTSSVLSPLENLEWRNFLARSPLLPPTADVLDALQRQTILITGAGGSIGAALAMRLCAVGCARLILLEASEGNLYALQRDLSFIAGENSGAVCSTITILGSAADAPLLEEIFAMHAPRVVFHAAAFKHVPLMEEQPLAAMANNIFATETLVLTAQAHGAHVVLLSTDKAVAPASVMGATKRVAEQIVLAAGGTALRLGNVLASRDSVAEVFARQIARGGPLTVTEPAARRYFLTLDEAVNLLLKAAAQTEPGTLLAPILPATHKIVDLARFMARELSRQREIAIDFTGRRPGDKESEELWSAAERVRDTRLDGLVEIETALTAEAQLASQLGRLRAALNARDLTDALERLRALVPDYMPSRAVLTLAAQCGARACL